MKSLKSFFFFFTLIFYIIFFSHIKKSKDSSAKYYHQSKEIPQKISIFSKEEKNKNQQYGPKRYKNLPEYKK